MATPDKVLELVEQFDYNLSSYRSGRYNETQVRREFIDPLFKVLGWDIDNEQGYAEALFEQIKHEPTIHADTEEPTFYVALEKASRTKTVDEKVDHAEGEHDEVRDYLDKLSGLDIRTTEWLVCFGELKHAVAHYVEEEEGEIFEKAKKYLSKEQAEQLAEEMDALKQERKAQLSKAA